MLLRRRTAGSRRDVAQVDKGDVQLHDQIVSSSCCAHCSTEVVLVPLNGDEPVVHGNRIDAVGMVRSSPLLNLVTLLVGEFGVVVDVHHRDAVTCLANPACIPPRSYTFYSWVPPAAQRVRRDPPPRRHHCEDD